MSWPSSKRWVAKRVAGRGLRDSGPAYGLVDCPLQDGLVKMVPAPLARGSIDIDAGCREDPLPAGVGILARKRPRQRHPAGSGSQIRLVLETGSLKMRSRRIRDFEDRPGCHRRRRLAPPDARPQVYADGYTC